MSVVNLEAEGLQEATADSIAAVASSLGSRYDRLYRSADGRSTGAPVGWAFYSAERFYEKPLVSLTSIVFNTASSKRGTNTRADGEFPCLVFCAAGPPHEPI